MANFGIGQALRRTEDVRFLTGTGQFVEDRNIQGQAWVGFVRSPVPHARIATVADALKHLGIHHIDMPLTPERVWRAIRDTGAAEA